MQDLYLFLNYNINLQGKDVQILFITAKTKHLMNEAIVCTVIW